MRIPKQPPDADAIIRTKADALATAFGDESYRALVARAEAAYQHWDKLRFLARAADLDPEIVWALVKLGRRYRKLPLSGHLNKPLRFTVPDRAQQELMLIDQQLAGRVAFDEDRPLTSVERERFIIAAFREEAIASSMLEGAATTRRVAEEMLRSGRKPRNRGEMMVANNYRAIVFVREHRRTQLSPEFIIELQRMLTENTLDAPDEVGRLRREDDEVVVVDPYGEGLHTPPPASELAHRITEFCTFANSGASAQPFVHPVIKACALHFQIGFDHPFCDGNGRTARALFYWSMLRDGYWLFEYLPISRLIYEGPAKYGRAYLYTETDEFDLTYFLLYKLRIISRARHDLREYLARKQADMTAARSLFEDDPTLNHRQQELLMQMARNPDRITTIERHRRVHSTAYGTARSDLLNLVERGYLTKEQRGKRFEFRRGPKLVEIARTG